MSPSTYPSLLGWVGRILLAALVVAGIAEIPGWWNRVLAVTAIAAIAWWAWTRRRRR